MKKYFKLLMVAMLATVSFCLASCGDDDEPETNKLVGTWVADDEGENFVYVFNADKTGEAYRDTPGSRHDLIIDYTIQNNHLLIMWEDDDEWDDKGTILSIDKKSFTLDLYDDNDILVFIKIA